VSDTHPDDFGSKARSIFLSELAPAIDHVQDLERAGQPVPEEARQAIVTARDRYYAAMGEEGRITVVSR